MAEHPHRHGRVDPSVVRSREGVRAVALGLLLLGITAAAEAVVFAMSGSVALLADLIHNGGDALTALPLGAAFLLHSERAERRAGFLVVAVIAVSALLGSYEAVDHLVHPHALHHLSAVAVAGVIGVLGNEAAARVRLRAGRRLDSPALLADGQHARVDGLVSLGVVASAVVVALGLDAADPIIGLAITALILKVTLAAWRTVAHGHHHSSPGHG